MEDVDDPFTPSGSQPNSLPSMTLPLTSPTQLKRTLEAHLTETRRRLAEAGKLGQDLVQQEKELSARLEDLNEASSGEEIDPELRRKLADLERDYNDVGRVAARALLTNKVALGAGAGERDRSPGVGSNLSTPSSITAHGTGSPSKLGLPSSRRQRNTTSSRHNDLEFAAELGQGLIAQIRALQAQLDETEVARKKAENEKELLEQQVKALEARIKTLDESDSRYKEENWDLTIRAQEDARILAEYKETEARLNTQIALLSHEKNTVIKELDEIKDHNAQITNELNAKYKQHDGEIATLRRHLANTEADRENLQKKVEDLKLDLEEAQKVSLRLRLQEQRAASGEHNKDESGQTVEEDEDSPEGSPPPSPVKHTPRHNAALESETLKSSLHHAHRMITSLKSNIHREKTEKAELKRLLQETRDELEAARSNFGTPTQSTTTSKRRKNDGTYKKSGKFNAMLGSTRKPQNEYFNIESPNSGRSVEIDMDDEWEEAGDSPEGNIKRIKELKGLFGNQSSAEDTGFETANERNSTDAFETANERETGTETEFMTGAESPINDNPTSADDTETETRSSGRTLRQKSSHQSGLSGRGPIRNPLRQRPSRPRMDSLVSTASTDDDNDFLNVPAYESQRYLDDELSNSNPPDHFPSDMDHDRDGPSTLSTSNPRYKLRINRNRSRQRVNSDGSLFSNPGLFGIGASPMSSPMSRDLEDSPVYRHSAVNAARKSLFAELGENSPGMMSAGEDEDADETVRNGLFGTPTRIRGFPGMIPVLSPLGRPIVEMSEVGCQTEEPYPETPMLMSEHSFGDRPMTARTDDSNATTLHHELESPRLVIKEMEERGTQSDQEEKPIMVEMGVQPEERVMGHKGAQTEARVVGHQGAQTDKAVVSSAGTQSEEEPKKVMASSGMQSMEEPKKMVSSAGTQSEVEPKKVMASSGTQPEEEVKKMVSSAGTQSEEEPKKVMASSGTQPEEEPKKAVTEMGTQFDPELEATFVFAAPRNSNDSIIGAAAAGMAGYPAEKRTSVIQEDKDVAITSPQQQRDAIIRRSSSSERQEPLVEKAKPNTIFVGTAGETAPEAPKVKGSIYVGTAAETMPSLIAQEKPTVFIGTAGETIPEMPELQKPTMVLSHVAETAPVMPVLPPKPTMVVSKVAETKPEMKALPNLPNQVFVGTAAETEPVEPKMKQLLPVPEVAPPKMAQTPLNFSSILEVSTAPIEVEEKPTTSNKLPAPVAAVAGALGLGALAEPAAAATTNGGNMSSDDEVLQKVSDNVESANEATPEKKSLFANFFGNRKSSGAASITPSTTAVPPSERTPRSRSPSLSASPTPSRNSSQVRTLSPEPITRVKTNRSEKKQPIIDEDEETIRRKDTPKSRPALPMMESANKPEFSTEYVEELKKELEETKKQLSITQAQTVQTLSTRPSEDSMRPVSRGRAGSSGKGSSSNVVPAAATASAIRRPSSSSSMRDRSRVHPPLPANHQEQIAAAAAQTSVLSATQDSTTSNGEVLATPSKTLMGPPPLPINRTPNNQRPRTPADSTTWTSTLHPTPSIASTSTSTTTQRRPETPRSQNNLSAPTTRNTRLRASSEQYNPSHSALSRRSSISSFASELDDRFNMDHHGYTPSTTTQNPGGTDPRVIQAITQTMIGEYLWKYTRTGTFGKASTTRHRRFVWVHPYTRTLYWSERDPQTGGKTELRAKSVAIEAVKVVNDDNPMPPGLHRKSLVIVTPGRVLKFTAPTGARHETWFSALSYLLLRTGESIGMDDPYTTLSSHAHVTADDDEPDYGTPTAMRGASSSLRSYRTDVTPSRNASAMSNRRPADQGSVRMAGSISRLSSIFRPGSAMGGYEDDVSGDEGGHGHHHGEHARFGEGLENVRACCDGKHDVGTLSRRGGRRSMQSFRGRSTPGQDRSQSQASYRAGEREGGSESHGRNHSHG